MSKKMSPDDPAYWMLSDGVTSKSDVYNPDCYICGDPEFAQMGLPLCYPCIVCGAHTPADDPVCDNGHEQPTNPDEEYQTRKEHGLEISKELLEKVGKES
jgi:hypothetical protein